MNQVILRASGNTKDLDNLRNELETKLGLVCGNKWKQGDKNQLGKIIKISGYNIFITDSANPKELVEDIELFVKSFKAKTISLSDISAELSIGITVGGTEGFIKTLDFSPVILSLIEDSGFILSVTAYPASD